MPLALKMQQHLEQQSESILDQRSVFSNTRYLKDGLKVGVPT